MKYGLFLFILAGFLTVCAKKPLPQMPVILEKNSDDDINTEVVVSSVANMLDGFSKIVPDPYNPVVVTTSLAQIGVSFLQILKEMFRNQPDLRADMITQEQFIAQFESLSPEAQNRILQLFVAYIHHIKNSSCNMDVVCRH